MIKKRTRPDQFRVREKSTEIKSSEDEEPQLENEQEKLSLEELIEIRKLRKSRRGIDADKLVKGNIKKKRKTDDEEEEEEQGGLRPGASVRSDEDDDEDEDAKTRKVVRVNNFTQQTNALDVDKHMMAYIEENLKVRSRPRDGEKDKKPSDPQEELYRLADRWKVDKTKPKTDDGSVTNSMSMLTAIPEVDLGMDTRLKNIEETEKAKRAVAEERQERSGKRPNTDEEHLVASRFYRPNLRGKSDSEILRDAKLEAMGLPPQDEKSEHSTHDRLHMATDELVMERFKKRMKKQ